MGRIEDLRRQAEAEDTAVTVAESPRPIETPTAISQEPIEIPETASTDTSVPAAQETPAVTPPVETVSKEDYDRQVDLVVRLNAELGRVTNALNTLKGKEYAEVPRLQAEVKTLKDRIAELEAIPPAVTNIDRTADIEAIRDEYGDKVGNVFQSMLEEIKTLKTGQAKPKPQEAPVVVPEQAPVASTQPPAAEQPTGGDFLSELTKAVPGWMFINGDSRLNLPADPKWPIFLAQKDNATGLTYQQILDIHVNNGNATGAAEIFKAFEGGNAVRKPTGQMTGVEAFVDPASTGGNVQPGPGSPTKTSVGNFPLTLAGFEQYKNDRIRRHLAHLTSDEVARIGDEFDTAFSKGLLK